MFKKNQNKTEQKNTQRLTGDCVTSTWASPLHLWQSWLTRAPCAYASISLCIPFCQQQKKGLFSVRQGFFSTLLHGRAQLVEKVWSMFVGLNLYLISLAILSTSEHWQDYALFSGLSAFGKTCHKGYLLLLWRHIIDMQHVRYLEDSRGM